MDQALPDGNTTTVVNHRLIVRDGQGRIYQERRALVPKGGDRPSAILRIEISDPVKHTKYFCDSQLTKCELRSYYAPVAETTQAVGPIGDGKRYLSRASLGSETMEGVEVIGTRETISTSASASLGTTRRSRALKSSGIRRSSGSTCK